MNRRLFALSSRRFSRAGSRSAVAQCIIVCSLPSLLCLSLSAGAHRRLRTAPSLCVVPRPQQTERTEAALPHARLHTIVLCGEHALRQFSAGCLCSSHSLCRYCALG